MWATGMLFAIFSFLPFWADIVVLVNGGKVVGRVVENNEKRVVVEVRWGTVEVRREDVQTVMITGVDELEEELKQEEAKKKRREEKEKTARKEEAEGGETEKGESKEEPEEKEKTEKESEGQVEKKEKEKPLTEEERKQLETLVMQIGHPEANIRRMGRLGLLRFGRRAVPQLIQSLSDGNFWRRMNACDILRETGDERALKPLVLRLRDENLYVRVAADNALKKLTGRNVSFTPQNPSEESIKEWERVVDEMARKNGKEEDK